MDGGVGGEASKRGHGRDGTGLATAGGALAPTGVPSPESSSVVSVDTGGDADGGSSMCSSTSYQTDASDLLDELSLAGEGDDDGVAEDLDALDAGLGDFLGALINGDDAEGEEEEEANDSEAPPAAPTLVELG